MINGELRTELCPDIFDGALDLAAIEAEDSGSLLCGSDPSDCCVESASRLLFAVLRTPDPKGALCDDHAERQWDILALRSAV